MTKFTRRQMLKTAYGVTLSGVSGIAPMMANLPAQAMSHEGYKALVFVFLNGGMDNWDTIIPFDNSIRTDANGYDAIRSTLISDYVNKPRDRESLRPTRIQVDTANYRYTGRTDNSFPPEMSGLHRLFQAGNAAIVGNVGPLIERITRTEFIERSKAFPRQLFSHNDQQATWATLSPEGGGVGWGGLIAEKTGVSSPFRAISTLGNKAFLSTSTSSAYAVSFGTDDVKAANILNTSESIGGTLAQGLYGEGIDETMVEAFFSEIETKVRANPDIWGERLKEEYGSLVERGLDNAADFNKLIVDAGRNNVCDQQGVVPSTCAGESLLALQLSRVLQVIKGASANVGTNNVSRQVFFVEMGGFDTHSTQARDLSANQQILSDGITAFYEALGETLQDRVTLATGSDFGRTLAVNGDGTDHGWGGHHFVVGGAVKGKLYYGEIPDPRAFNVSPNATLSHARDAGSGRLIPAVSVEEYARPLAKWFGLDDAQIHSIFPRLNPVDGGDGSPGSLSTPDKNMFSITGGRANEQVGQADIDLDFME